MINGSPDVSTSDDRLVGYNRAMQEAGFQDYEVCYYGGFNQETGYKLTKKAILQSPRPTALFAANNLIGIGTLKALQEMGLRVPEDIAVVSFDDLPSNLIISPFLTVASQPVYEMSQKATELLISRINCNNPDKKYKSQNIVLPVELIVRSSSGNAI